MDALTDAVEAYGELEQQHEDEPQEFIMAIHRLQDLLAVRLCRRLYPEGWVTYGPQENGEMQDSQGTSPSQREREARPGKEGCEAGEATTPFEIEGEGEEAARTVVEGEAA
jgi:hypothetical protein